MAAFAGAIFRMGYFDGPPGKSADVDEGTASFGGGKVTSACNAGGGKTGDGRIDVLPVAELQGGIVGQPGEAHIFERIHVLPNKKKVGFVLSTVVFQVEVWNGHVYEEKSLTSISIGGVGGLQISGGISAPGIFGPMRSAIYTATLGTDGDSTIANVATFVFTGEAGATLEVTGTRLTVFSPEIDWSAPFEESIEFKTNVIQAYSGNEQRIQLRTLPRYGASFRVLTLSPRDTAALDALLVGWQARVYGVPWWMDASPLQAQASAGALTLQVDTTNKAFEAGGIVMLWRDQHTWEALQVLSVSSSSMTLVSQTTKSWIAGDLVVPMKRGRLGESASIQRETSSIASFQASFSCEVV